MGANPKDHTGTIEATNKPVATTYVPKKVWLQHDEIGVTPFSHNEKEGQNYMSRESTCSDYLMEKYIACAYVDDCVEVCMCQTDTMLCTCEVSDWMETTTGFELCHKDDTYEVPMSSASVSSSSSGSCLMDIVIDEEDDITINVVDNTGFTAPMARNTEEKTTVANNNLVDIIDFEESVSPTVPFSKEHPVKVSAEGRSQEAIVVSPEGVTIHTMTTELARSTPKTKPNLMTKIKKSSPWKKKVVDNTGFTAPIARNAKEKTTVANNNLVEIYEESVSSTVPFSKEPSVEMRSMTKIKKSSLWKKRLRLRK